jgi:excisionase family DNA binding protein
MLEIVAAPDESPQSARLARALAAGDRLDIVSPGQEPIPLSPHMRRVLAAAAAAFAEGRGIVFGADEVWLTTQEAADRLGVSRPTLVKILEAGEIPFERPGGHRRIRLSALAAYGSAERDRRRAVLDRMADDFAGMSRLPEPFVETR